MNPMQVSVEEIATLLGAKDIEIHFLQKQIQALQRRIADLEPKPDVQPELQAVR